jgi:pyruvate,water dikinase
VARLLASSRLLDMAISHPDRVEPMVEAFFKADYDFLGEGLTQPLPGFYTQDGAWTRVEEDGRTLFVQDGTEWGAGLTSGFTKLMRKVVGGPKYQGFLDNVQMYFHFPKAIAKGSAVADAALALRVRPMDGVIDQAGGLAFAVRNMANYFVLRINALEDNVILFEFVNGRRYQRATAARRIETGRWYSVTAVVRGNCVQGFLDGEALFEYGADRPLEGYVGMLTKADSLTHFADLKFERRA